MCVYARCTKVYVRGHTCICNSVDTIFFVCFCEDVCSDVQNKHKYQRESWHVLMCVCLGVVSQLGNGQSCRCTDGPVNSLCSRSLNHQQLSMDHNCRVHDVIKELHWSTLYSSPGSMMMWTFQMIWISWMVGIFV